ncbi:MAG: sigma-54 dependent transcriptional regulator [Zoogloeaceae bacterium]|jgi:two-component system response regulator PilR (NtrC family)|nr:sigma-54 dependent transcriptional regulator [Zoogloeaceae bacterium]
MYPGKEKNDSKASRPRVLIIDDEADIRELLDLTIARMGMDTDCAATVGEAMDFIARQNYQLCLTDMRLPDGDGLEIVRHLNGNDIDTPVAVITAYGSAENAVAALKAGAFDYLAKPVGLEQLRTLVRSALRLNESGKNAVPHREDENDDKRMLIGSSPAMVRVAALIEKLAKSQAPIYISGESGSGKEVAARRIHAASTRAEAPFIPVNCGAIPENLMESEFFGYKKGAFTGADSDRAGFFQAAQGGTLFLDEVADLPLPMQVKLLRVIQEKKVRQVGSTSETAIDVRIISATHKNLRECVEQGNFRQDLYYRLNVIELAMPPLRDRREDIPELVEFILRRISAGQIPRLDDSAWRSLDAYPFPGNVRELENILERATALCADNCICADDLQLGDTEWRPATNAAHETFNDDSSAERQTRLPETLADYLNRIERAVLADALEQTAQDFARAARHLGISPASFAFRQQRLRGRVS